MLSIYRIWNKIYYEPILKSVIKLYAIASQYVDKCTVDRVLFNVILNST